MSTETIDLAEPPAPSAPERPAAGRSQGPLARLRADPQRARAARESGRALWSSRLLVWAAGVGTVLAFGFGPVRGAFNPPGMTRGFGRIGDLLAAPAARWDAAWYLVIAHYGYRPDLGHYLPAITSRDAFFPLYPLGIHVVALVGTPPILAGVLISCAALAGALYGIHRLTTLELGGRAMLAGGADRGARAASLAVLVTALAPMAFFLSAVYSESLYLALSVGLFWSARNGRWAWVGVLGMLAGATRSAGLVLALPAVMIYLYGPREDRAADFARGARSRLLPRYRVRRDALWLALLPLGVILYGAYLGLEGGGALSPLKAQNVWGRHYAGPFVAVWEGAVAGWDGALQLLAGSTRHIYFPAAPGSPSVAAEHNLLLLAFLAFAAAAIIGVARTLPAAYGAYVVAALALPLSYPVRAQPLMSLPRFLLVLFPLSIWLGWWLAAHPRLQRPLIALSALLMCLFTAEFSTWHWVA